MKPFFLLILVCLALISCKPEQNVKGFVCPPCDQTCDNQIFGEDGVCPHCGMNLIERLDSTDINKINIHGGSGSFLVEGGLEHKSRTIRAFYHKPQAFTAQSKILLVIPGAGRNGHDYRDSWIDASEQHNVLVVALQYPEGDYDFGRYHLANMVVQPASPAASFYEMNSNSAEWLYRDFDRIFREVCSVTKSKQQSYDIFGHSAGGQILHRMALFQDYTKADRIIAANSGWYTLPSDSYIFPYGIRDTYMIDDDLAGAFKKDLLVLVGEEDNQYETRGHLRVTEKANAQGAHRLERAQFFVNNAREKAEEIKADFNWNIQMVPGVGHDYKGISMAAAKILYE